MQTYSTKLFDGRHYIELYIPARTCFVLKEKVILPPAQEPAGKSACVKEEDTAASAETKPARKRSAKKPAEEMTSPEKKKAKKRTTNTGGKN